MGLAEIGLYLALGWGLGIITHDPIQYHGAEDLRVEHRAELEERWAEEKLWRAQREAALEAVEDQYEAKRPGPP